MEKYAWVIQNVVAKIVSTATAEQFKINDLQILKQYFQVMIEIFYEINTLFHFLLSIKALNQLDIL